MIAQCGLLLGCIDPHLGRLDYASLPQQALMEMLVDGITNREIIWDGSKESPEDISEWYYVDFNATSEVIEIDWSGCNLDGSLSLEWLPATVTDLTLSRNALTGTLNLAHLPKCLKLLYLYGNAFDGEIDLRNLPGNLEEMNASSNNLVGNVDLENLPDSLKELYLSSNMLNGSLRLTKLPDSLRYLDLSSNDFSGTIDLRTLPPNIIELGLDDNSRLTGETDFSCLPKSLWRLNISFTNLSGDLYIRGIHQFSCEESKVKLILATD